MSSRSLSYRLMFPLKGMARAIDQASEGQQRQAVSADYETVLRAIAWTCITTAIQTTRFGFSAFGIVPFHYMNTAIHRRSNAACFGNCRSNSERTVCSTRIPHRRRWALLA